MKKLLLLLLALVPLAALAQQPIQRNDITTNTLSVPTDAVVTINGHIPLGVATTHTNAYLMRRFGGPTFFDVRLFDNGLVMSAAYASNAPPDISGITNSTDVVGIGDFALDSLVGDGLLNIYAIGPSALAGTTLAPFSSQIFAYGNSPLSGALLTNATEIYAIGTSSGENLVSDGSSSIYMFGNSGLNGSTVNASGPIYTIGENVLDSATVDNSFILFGIGSHTMSGVTITNSSTTVYAIGDSALDSAVLDSANSVFMLGNSAGVSAIMHDPDSIVGIGGGAFQLSRITNSSDIVGIGNFALDLAKLDASTDVYAIGSSAGLGLSGTFNHVFLIGSGATATADNQWVAGDANYLYQFPGVEATFGGFVALSGNTNQYTDDGSTLLRNGVAIGGGDTTGTNVVTLTQTGTNVSSMNFALVQNGGLFKIALTNNAFMPTPSNVAAGRHAWLAVQQPSTGTCLVTWTNGTFNGPEGQLLINDTNNGAVVYYEMVSDAFTNGVVNLWMSTRMARMP